MKKPTNTNTSCPSLSAAAPRPLASAELTEVQGGRGTLSLGGDDIWGLSGDDIWGRRGSRK